MSYITERLQQTISDLATLDVPPRERLIAGYTNGLNQLASGKHSGTPAFDTAFEDINKKMTQVVDHERGSIAATVESMTDPEFSQIIEEICAVPFTL